MAVIRHVLNRQECQPERACAWSSPGPCGSRVGQRAPRGKPRFDQVNGHPPAAQLAARFGGLGYGADVLTESCGARAARCLPYSRYVSQTTTTSKTVSPRSPMENAKVIR